MGVVYISILINHRLTLNNNIVVVELFCTKRKYNDMTRVVYV